ncbi:MAG: A/G-specific adenine glycosylase [bacterium]
MENMFANFNHVFTQEGLTASAIMLLRNIIYNFYASSGRDLPWRRTDNPYCILVSEIMLQQTRVDRVIPKYELFIKTFPDISSLAKAPTKHIIELWQGLGYNRRALSLHKCARIIVNEFQAEVPSHEEDLRQLPGIGKATASAIASFAFNKPTVFIETNIRTVFIHFFFKNDWSVQDRQLFPLIEQTLDHCNPRHWYYAIMDYGVYLKKTGNDNNRQSAHYNKQSPFQGSNRQIRGMILKYILTHSGSSENELVCDVKSDYTAIKKNLIQLEKEGFIRADKGGYKIAE